LTVRAHKAGSHARKGWETFTAAAIRAVLQRTGQPGVVFMAWGAHAEKTCDKIGIDKVCSYAVPRFSTRFFSKLIFLHRKSILFSGQCRFTLSNMSLLNGLDRSAHPSPLSAHRGFLGNGHFRQANEWLGKNYGKDAQIDWTVLSTK